MSKKRYCSFCGKDGDEVAQLIAGPMVNICNECVALCMEICLSEWPIADQSQVNALIAHVTAPPPRQVFTEAQEARLREIVTEMTGAA